MTNTFNQGDYILRQFEPNDWSVYKAIRLEALQKEPMFFGSSYERESAEADEQWKNYVSNPIMAFWGLYLGDNCIGLTGISEYWNQPDSLVLRGSYIQKEHRQKGLSSLFYQARLQWAAKQQGFKRIIVSHRASNEASKASNQKFGFKYTYTEDKKWPDGKVEGHVFYELPLL